MEEKQTDVTGHQLRVNFECYTPTRTPKGIPDFRNGSCGSYPSSYFTQIEKAWESSGKDEGIPSCWMIEFVMKYKERDFMFGKVRVLLPVFEAVIVHVLSAGHSTSGTARGGNDIRPCQNPSPSSLWTLARRIGVQAFCYARKFYPMGSVLILDSFILALAR